MEYTGRTQVGGAPQSRQLGTLALTKLAVGPLDNNVYLLEGRAGTRLLIDAATDPAAIESALLVPGGLDWVLTTHRHHDHWGALAEVASRTGAQTMAGSADADAIEVATDRRLSHGEVIDLDGTALRVIELRGHTPGGVALAFADDTGRYHLITGDSLFPGGVGRTTSDTFGELLADVTTRIFDVYPDDTWVYPGHGWDTNLGTERPHLAEWRERGW